MVLRISSRSPTVVISPSAHDPIHSAVSGVSAAPTIFGGVSGRV
jgi:hypothetical protein